jgi:hypothetical protein
MDLRVSGVVPQLVGAEELALTAPAKPRRRIALIAAPEAQAPAPAMAWSAFAAARATGAATPLGAEDAPFGALVAPAPLPASAAALDLSIEQPPSPSVANAIWSL